MRRVVRGFWGPRPESERELAARWSALLTRLRDIDPAVFGTWQEVPDATNTDALAARLRERNAGDDWSDRKGYAMALSTPAANPVKVSVSGTGGGVSEHLPMSVVLTITAPDDDGAALPYAEILRAVAETWDVDWGEVTQTELQLALEDDGREPGQACVGWAGYLSERRAALLTGAGAGAGADAALLAGAGKAPDVPGKAPGLPGKTEPTEHGGLLLDLSGAGGVEDLVAVNREVRATGALEALPRPMDRAKL
ncbi:hypothetical protein QWM81_21880 [Streptomyces ficellus]|uniref:Immunity protein 52 domain-containing protein n=1 Tax=Streptomyces ficellus TaxID=1977088 RepID=A0ABT7ZAV8_9ACTN|nr:Imm52 family immunity protein [Streptomyces ficellus]MDN3296644.1 hypothetical protein [Streptomyces ficellus]